jgi:hypothetical protein
MTVPILAVGDPFTAAVENIIARWGVATAYTPLVTASTTNPTMGTTGLVQTGSYFQIGKLVVYNFAITFGTSMTAGSGTYAVSLPVTASGAPGSMGTARLYHFAGGYVLANARLGSPTTLNFQYNTTYVTGALVNAGNAGPWVWAAGDIIDGTVTYQAA